MKLKELSKLMDIPPEEHEIEFNGLTNDSKSVQPGNLFIAINGYKQNGFLYLDEAIRKGASAALIESGLTGPPGFPAIPVENIRRVQGLVASRFNNEPSRRLRVIGVTGTNGKTTVTHLIKHLLSSAGIPVGLIGTVWIENGRERKNSVRTTPDSIELQQILAEMVANGMRTVVMEVSSHALALERVAGVEFDVAVLTNVTHDHYDFHHNYQEYLEAKSLLFKGLQAGTKNGKYLVLNADEPCSRKIAENCRLPVFYFGISEKTGNAVRYIGRWERENILNIDLLGEVCKIKSELPGLFNIYNVLAAITVARLEGLSVREIEQALPNFPGVPGRYQEIHCGQPFGVMVDFAHNPAALENILKTARGYTKEKLILVFGCEGEKDRLKRPLMGKIASQNADIVILTSDNVYGEDPGQIFDDVMKNLSETERARLIAEPDRKKAIMRAIDYAEPGDFVIVAGKGHEQYLVKGSEQIPFNDVQVLEELLSYERKCLQLAVN